MKKYLFALLIIVLIVGGVYLIKQDAKENQQAQSTQQQDQLNQIEEVPPVEPEVEVPSLEQVDEVEHDKTFEEVKELEEELEKQDQEEETMTNPTVLMKTTLGDIKIELFMETMPVTAGNFKKLVEKGYYDGVIFHRVIPGFMVQGGDPTGTGRGGPGYQIKDEFTNNNKNERGTLSMANAGPNTGGSQFFINVNNNNFLDDKHPVFGKVIEGMDVVDKIVNVPRNAMDKPNEDVVMEKVTIE